MKTLSIAAMVCLLCGACVHRKPPVASLSVAAVKSSVSSAQTNVQSALESNRRTQEYLTRGEYKGSRALEYLY